LSKLEDEIKALEDSHDDFMKRFQAASDDQIQHHRQMMNAEKSYLLQLQQIEEEISKQRLKSLQMVEVSDHHTVRLLLLT
jgi:predicted  nucleic acid-binding Zn-ribbon protein